jgi:hypothetical protein
MATARGPAGLVSGSMNMVALAGSRPLATCSRQPDRREQLIVPQLFSFKARRRRAGLTLEMAGYWPYIGVGELPWQT